MGANRKGRPLTRKRKFAFALLTSLTVLLALEGLCRLTEKRPRTRPSDLLGFEPVPGYRGRGKRINEHGLRGAEVRERTPETFRVLAMGGSTTWGHNLPDDESWPFLLERELVRRGLDGAEVLNGGYPAWGLEQIVLALEHRHLPRLETDLVLVFSGWNYPVLEGNQYVISYRRKAAASRERNWLHSFAIARWLDRRFEKLAPDLLPDQVVSERLDEVVRDQEEVMREEFPGLCRRLREVCDRFDVPVAVIAYPALVNLLPPEDDPLYARFGEVYRNEAPARGEDAALFAEGRRRIECDLAIVRAAGREAGIPLVEVDARMRTDLGSLSPRERSRVWLSYFKDFMHLTKGGNEAFAAAAATELAAMGLLPAR